MTSQMMGSHERLRSLILRNCAITLILAHRRHLLGVKRTGQLLRNPKMQQLSNTFASLGQVSFHAETFPLGGRSTQLHLTVLNCNCIQLNNVKCTDYARVNKKKVDVLILNVENCDNCRDHLECEVPRKIVQCKCRNSLYVKIWVRIKPFSLPRPLYRRN